MFTFPLFSSTTVSLFLKEKPDRAGETSKETLRQNRGVLKVCVKAGVHSSGQRGWADWAGLG